jgi:hypothetical protein
MAALQNANLLPGDIDDQLDSTITPGNADSGFNVAGDYIYLGNFPGVTVTGTGGGDGEGLIDGSDGPLGFWGLVEG